MAGELPDSERLAREAESLRRRVRELESESLDVTRTLAETEARLKECQDDFRVLMETVPEMVSRHHPDGTYVYVSPACTRLFGYLPEDLVGRQAYDFMHPEDVSIVMAVVQRALETGGLEVGEYRHLTKDGAYVWVETIGRVILDEGRDEPRDIICVVRDITARKPAKETLQESEERYRLLFGDAEIGVGYYTPEGVLMAFNKVAAQHLRGSPEDFVGKSLKDLFGERAGSVYQARVHEVAQSGQSQTHEDAVSLPVGDMYFRSQYTAIRNADGKVMGVQIIASDITDRKQAEDALRESEERFRLAAQCSSDFIYEWDIQTGQARYFGDIDGYLGYAPGEFPRTLIGWMERVHPDDLSRVLETFREESEHGKPFEMQYCLRRSDGTYAEWLDRGVVIWDAAGKPVKNIGALTDVTERKRAEEALRKSEERFRYVLENVHDAVWSADLSGQFDFLSPVMADIYGRPLSEMIANPAFWIEAMHPDDQATARSSHDALLRDSSVECEYRIVLPNGTVRWISDRKTLLRDEHGEDSRMAGIVSNITEHKRAEEALRKSEERYRAVLEDQTEIICRFQSDGTFTFVNDVFCRFYGKQPQDLIGKQWQPMVVPEDLPHVEAQLRTLSASNPVVVIENRVFSGSGQVHWMQLVNRGFFDAEGRLTEIQAVGRDISERIKAEDLLRQVNIYTRSLIEASVDALVTIGPDGKITDVNHATEEVTGLVRDALIGTNFSSYFTDPQRATAGYEQVFRDGKVRDYALSLRHRDGRITPVLYNAALYRDESGRVVGVFAAAHDITVRKRAEEALVAQRDLAIALSRTTGLQETLRLCLDAALSVSGMDCGGIYLVDTRSGSMDLAFAVGLTAAFTAVSSHYEPDSGNTRLVMTGRALYGRHQELGLNLSASELGEGLRALAIIPVQHDGRIIGCVNVASHVLDEISVFSRAALETIAGQVGSGIHRSQTEEALEASQEDLRALASELARAEEQERRHIAAYLHDEIGQLLAAVRVKLGSWKARNPSMNAPELLLDIERTIDQTIDDARLLTYEISPPILFELGLGPALEWIGERLCEEHGIVFKFRDSGQSKWIPEELAGALYRIAQELLMNMVKHAQAKHASVSVALTADAVQVVVEDDGIGMPELRRMGKAPHASEHFGLLSIRERLGHFGGSLNLDSTPGRGTRATVTAPLVNPVVSKKGALS